MDREEGGVLRDLAVRFWLRARDPGAWVVYMWMRWTFVRLGIIALCWRRRFLVAVPFRRGWDVVAPVGMRTLLALAGRRRVVACGWVRRSHMTCANVRLSFLSVTVFWVYEFWRTAQPYARSMVVRIRKTPQSFPFRCWGVRWDWSRHVHSSAHWEYGIRSWWCCVVASYT